MQNVRKLTIIRLVTPDKKRIYLVSEPNCHTTKWFSENPLAIEVNEIKVKIDKPIYLGLSVLEISETIMYEIWYDYIKRKYGDKANLCYIDRDRFIKNIKTEDAYKDIANDVGKESDTSNYETELD